MTKITYFYDQFDNALYQVSDDYGFKSDLNPVPTKDSSIEEISEFLQVFQKLESDMPVHYSNPEFYYLEKLLNQFDITNRSSDWDGLINQIKRIKNIDSII